MSTIELKCKKCNKKLLSYDPTLSIRKYSSPVRQCKGCGNKYADPRYHEIAVEGLPADTYNIPSYIIMMIFGAFVLYRGLHLLQRYQLGVPSSIQWLLPGALIIGGLVMIVGGLIEIIMIETGVKAKKYQKLLEESEKRLQDKSYAYTLQDLGYHVPEQFL